MRVLLTTHPIASHFAPLIPIGKALQKVGHSVAVASASDFHPFVIGAGFNALVSEPDWKTDSDIARVMAEQERYLGGDHAAFVVQNLFIRTVGKRSLNLMEKAINSWNPDIIISEITEFTARLVAERKGLPVATVHFGIDMGKSVWKNIIKGALDDLRIDAGLSIDPQLNLMTGELSLCLAPSSYQPKNDIVSDNCHFFRPSQTDQIYEDGLPSWIEDLPDRPNVYATLGNAFGSMQWIFEKIVDGLSSEHVNTIITVGHGIDPGNLRARSSNLHIERFIPNSLLLPCCQVVICHAGYGTVMGSLIAGLPMVLIPLAADQFHHAARCKELGVAMIINKNDITPQTIRHAVRKMLYSYNYKLCAKKMKEDIDNTPDVENSISLFENLVRTRKSW